jgi:hypothetical protein
VTAPVRIEASDWGELKYATLARLMGFVDADHALVKVAKIWAWQTEHYTPERPTYVVDPEIAESALGPGGAAALLRARLAEEVPEGLLIPSAQGRIEWLHQRRSAAVRGGEATRRKHHDKIGPVGQPAAGPSAGPKPGRDPGLDHGDSASIGDLQPSTCSDEYETRPSGLALGQPSGEPSGEPSARPKPGLLTLTLPEEDLSPARARAIPPSTEAAPLTPAAREHADRRRKLIVDAWARAGREFIAVQAEGISPEMPNSWGGLPAAESVPMTNLRAIVDELLVGSPPKYEHAWTVIERRVLVAGAEARRRRDAQYMAPSRMWNRDSFSIASELSPEQVARARAGPKGSAERVPEPVRRVKTL